MTQSTNDEIYEEALRSLGSQGSSYEKSYGLYDKHLAEAQEAYRRMADEARVNKALLERAARSSDKAAGITMRSGQRTIGQRNENNLQNTLGSIERQHEDYRENVEHALSKLAIQEAAEDRSYAARKAADEGANRLSQQRFDADFGLQQNWQDLHKKQSDFNKAYQLYLKRLFGPKQFKEMTGIKVKKLPSPQKPRNIFADLKKTINEQGLLLNGKTPEQSTAEDWVDYLKNNEAQLVKKYGEDQFKTALGYYHMKDFDSALGGYSPHLKTLEEMIDTLGTKKEPDIFEFYKSFESPYIKALGEMSFANDVLSDVNFAYSFSWLQENYPEIAGKYKYADSAQDEVLRAMDIIPGFVPEDLAKELKDYQIPEKWDSASVGELLDTYAKRRNIAGEKKNGIFIMNKINRAAEQLGADMSDPFYLMGGIKHVTEIIESLSKNPDSAKEKDIKYVQAVINQLNNLPEIIQNNIDNQRRDQILYLIDTVNSDGIQTAFDRVNEAKGFEIASEYGKDILADTAVLIGQTGNYIHGMASNKELSKQAQIDAGNRFGTLEIRVNPKTNTREWATTFNTATGMLIIEPYLCSGVWRTDPQLHGFNDNISYLMMQQSMGLALDAEKVADLERGGMGAIVETIKSKPAGCYFEATENAVKEFLGDMLKYAEKDRKWKIKLGKAEAVDKDIRENGDFEAVVAAMPDVVGNWNPYFKPSSRGLFRPSADDLFGAVKTGYMVNHLQTEADEGIFFELEQGLKDGIITQEQFDGFIKQIEGNIAVTEDLREAWSGYGFITKDNLDTFTYLYKKGRETGDFTGFYEYFNIFETELTEAQWQAYYGRMKEITEEPGPLGEILSFVSSMGGTAASPIAYLETLSAAIVGEDVDTSSPAQLLTHGSTQFGELAVSTIEDPFLKKMARTVVYLAPRLPWFFVGAGPAFMGLSSAGIDAVQQNRMGATPWESAAHSTFTGAIDYFSSKALLNGFSRIMAGTSIPASFGAKILAYGVRAFKFGVVGGTVAAQNVFAKNLTDMLTVGDRSRYAQLANLFKSEGMTKDEAMTAAAVESFFAQPAKAFIESGGRSAAFSLFGSVLGEIKAGLGGAGTSGLPVVQGGSSPGGPNLPAIIPNGGVPAYTPDSVANAVKAVMALPPAALPAAEYNGIMNAYYAYGLNPADANAQIVIDLAGQSLEKAGSLKPEGSREEPDIDSKTGMGDNKSGNARDSIDGIEIIDGKVGGKIPADEFKAFRKLSIKNPDADTMTLGKHTAGQDSYTKMAGGSTYFDMGDKWNIIKKKYGLNNNEMFYYFNRPALDDAISGNKIIRFSHNPIDYSGSFLADEWEYIKDKLNLTDANLEFEGGFWYVRL